MVAKEITILTWNIQRGGSSARLSKIVENIERHNADIVVLSEFQNKPSGDSLRAALVMQGLIHQACATAGLRLNTVLIASRLKFELVPMTDLEPCDSSRCMLARFEELDLYGVYFAQNNAKRSLWRYLLNMAGGCIERNVVVVGDFNTGLEGPDGTGFYCRQEFKEFTDLWGPDAWRRLHPEAPEYSWYSYKGKGESREKHQGFRIDHAFVSPPLTSRLKGCEFSHLERDELKASDHSGMLVRLNLTPREFDQR